MQAVSAPEAATGAVAGSTAGPRLAVVACGCALAGAAAYVAVNDPSASGSLFPACVFHQTTGLWCPGCGLTRATHELFRGNVGAALGMNLLVPFFLAAIALSWWSWARTAWGRPPLGLPTGSGRTMAVVAPVVLLVFGVLRNLPVAPLRALAP